MKRESYHTKQKEFILSQIKEMKYEFTVKDLYDGIHHRIGLTTIYRFIDKLVDEGRLSKYIGKANVTYYQYLEECQEDNHFYLKCDKCGVLIHVDCDCIKDLSLHIVNDHHFRPTRDKFMIHGICEECCMGGLK